MRIRVTTYGFAGRLLEASGRPVDIELPEGATATQVISALEIDSEEIALVTVNGRRTAEGARLSPGDHVRLFAPVGGG